MKIKHDPLDKFGNETVYGRVELFFENTILLINYDYAPYPLFGSKDDDHPKFSISKIDENEAKSALEKVSQIETNINQKIEGITLVEDDIKVFWNEKANTFKTLAAIIFKMASYELGIEGDFMMPLLDVFKVKNAKVCLSKPGQEFDNDKDTKFEARRSYITL